MYGRVPCILFMIVGVGGDMLIFRCDRTVDLGMGLSDINHKK